MFPQHLSPEALQERIAAFFDDPWRVAARGSRNLHDGGGSRASSNPETSSDGACADERGGAGSPVPEAGGHRDERGAPSAAAREAAAAERASSVARAEAGSYRPGLGMSELISVIRALLERRRLIDWLLCRYLADLADRVAQRGYDLLGGYADIYHATRVLFGMSVRRTRESVRIGRALRALPQIERAFVDGRLGYSRVRELTRVATSENEAAWLRLACEVPMRVLERRVAEAGGLRQPECRSSEPAEAVWTSPDHVEVHLTLRAEAWALLQRAMEGARRAADGDALLSDSDALEAVARDAIARQSDTQPADVRRTVVLYECVSCKRTEIETGAGPVEVGDVAAATLGCAAQVVDLRSEGRFERRGGPIPAAIARAVRLRDRDCCRVPGCTRRRYVDVHHLVARAGGGIHSRSNCVCLCSTHHRMLHDGQLVIEGDADIQLRFYDAAGNELVQHQTASTAQPRTAGEAPPGATQSGSSSERLPASTETSSTGDWVRAAPPVGTTQSGSSTDAPTSERLPWVRGWATQRGSPDAEGSGVAPTATGIQRTPPSEGASWIDEASGGHARTVLRAMDAHRAWTVDELCEKTRLAVPTVCAVLGMYEVEGRISRDFAGRFRTVQ